MRRFLCFITTLPMLLRCWNSIAAFWVIQTPTTTALFFLKETLRHTYSPMWSYHLFFRLSYPWECSIEECSIELSHGVFDSTLPNIHIVLEALDDRFDGYQRSCHHPDYSQQRYRETSKQKFTLNQYFTYLWLLILLISWANAVRIIVIYAGKETSKEKS